MAAAMHASDGLVFANVVSKLTACHGVHGRDIRGKLISKSTRRIYNYLLRFHKNYEKLNLSPFFTYVFIVILIIIVLKYETESAAKLPCRVINYRSK